MSCLQAIEGEDIENPFICHIMNLLCLLSDKGTCVRFCWIPSLCTIEGNERVDQLAKDTIDHDLNPPAGVHYTDLKPLVNFIQRVGSNQVGCCCTWQRYISCETTTWATEEIPAHNQGWRGCDHSSSNWPSPPSPISRPEDSRLLVTIVVKHRALTICWWSVQGYRNVMRNTG